MNLFRTLSSLTLAVLVLMASSSFYVGVHLCGDTVKAIAFLRQADGCGHQELPPCHRKAMEGCCNDEQVVHQPQELKAEVTGLVLPLPLPSGIIQNSVVLAEIIPSSVTVPSPCLSDHPPTLTGNDILISIQSFLI
ncbi:MAG: hypothetical protein MUE95_13705 [Cyclobacteriaceae bacterium]|jgi:hypothetical protein|nr:hypothetical protein [Cyclobacteriaceae bacterium]